LASKFFSFICLGEAGKIVVLSIPEGDIVGFCFPQQEINKGIKVFPISAKTGEGMTGW